MPPAAPLNAPGYAGQCAGTTPWGPYIGVHWIYYRYYNGGDGTGTGTEIDNDAEYECVDPPHYNDQAIRCAYSVGGIGLGPMNNPAVPSRTINFPTTLSAFVTSGMKSVALCGQNFVQNFDYYSDQYGRYELDATGRQVACTQRIYTTPDARTGAIPPTEIVACGGTFPYDNASVRWQVWCGGVSLGWNPNHEFTEMECGDGTANAKWACNTDGPPNFDGRTATSYQVLDDGKTRNAKWNAPNLTGEVRNPRNKATSFVMQKGSTPIREGVAQNAPNQPVVGTPSLGSPHGGWFDTLGINWQQAGFPGKPSVTVPTWTFTADFAHTTVTGITFNPQTGVINLRTGIAYVPANAFCGGEPLTVDVNRARSSN